MFGVRFDFAQRERAGVFHTPARRPFLRMKPKATHSPYTENALAPFLWSSADAIAVIPPNRKLSPRM